MIQQTFQKESAMYSSNLQKYQLQLNLMRNQYNPMNPDKPHNEIYAAIPPQSLLSHITPDKESSFHGQMAKPIYMGSPQSG